MITSFKRSLLIFFLMFSVFGNHNWAQTFDTTSLPEKPLPPVYRKLFLQPVNIPKFQFDKYNFKINYPILAGVGLGLGTVVYSITNYYRNTWWRENSRAFHFTNDWHYALWIDKVGHMYSTYVIEHVFSGAFEAANIDPETAMWLGLAGGLGIQFYVEINDGYGPNWGFSPGDALFDILGAVYVLGQHYYPPLKNYQMRVSYFPSQELLNGQKPDNNFSDDYEGQKLWLAFRMKKILPESIARYWPSFLMLSVGMGIKDYSKPKKKHQEFYIAFDLDAEELPLHGGVWQFIKNTLNYIHLPLPGVRISPDGAFFMFLY